MSRFKAALSASKVRRHRLYGTFGWLPITRREKSGTLVALPVLQPHNNISLVTGAALESTFAKVRRTLYGPRLFLLVTPLREGIYAWYMSYMLQWK